MTLPTHIEAAEVPTWEWITLPPPYPTDRQRIDDELDDFAARVSAASAILRAERKDDE